MRAKPYLILFIFLPIAVLYAGMSSLEQSVFDEINAARNGINKESYETGQVIIQMAKEQAKFVAENFESFNSYNDAFANKNLVETELAKTYDIESIHYNMGWVTDGSNVAEQVVYYWTTLDVHTEGCFGDYSHSAVGLYKSGSTQYAFQISFKGQEKAVVSNTGSTSTVLESANFNAGASPRAASSSGGGGGCFINR